MSESKAVEAIKKRARRVYDDSLCRGNVNCMLNKRDDLLQLRALKDVLVEMEEKDIAKDLDVLMKRIKSKKNRPKT